MDCRRYRDALSDAAAGTLAEERQRALDEHLARCAACAARLERLKHSMAEIDRALAESAEAEPSAELLRGFHERLESVGAAHSRPARISPRAVAVAAAVLALLAAAWIVHGRFAVPAPHVAPPFRAAQEHGPAQRAAPHAVIPNAAAPLAERLATTPGNPGAVRRERSASPRHPRPARRVAPKWDQSIFAEAKIQPEGPAITRLVELINSDKIDARSLLPPPETKIQPIVIKPIAIQPISIPPLEIGGDSSKPNGQPSDPASSGASEAGANKERKP